MYSYYSILTISHAAGPDNQVVLITGGEVEQFTVCGCGCDCAREGAANSPPGQRGGASAYTRIGVLAVGCRVGVNNGC